jgi:RNA polymerase sigma factor (sigma-70 family)
VDIPELYRRLVADEESDEPKLTERERKVLRWRYGADPQTLAQVSEQLNVPPGRVRQIESQALRKLGDES